MHGIIFKVILWSVVGLLAMATATIFECFSAHLPDWGGASILAASVSIRVPVIICAIVYQYFVYKSYIFYCPSTDIGVNLVPHEHQNTMKIQIFNVFSPS